MKQYTGNGYTIYKHTNKVNGKVYIGQTKAKDLTRRWSGGHGYKQCFYFFSAIVRYGWLNFDHEILETGIPDSKTADERERYYIEQYQSRNPRYGYNIQSGGSGANEFSKTGYQNAVKNLSKGTTGCAVTIFDTDGRRIKDCANMNAAAKFLGCGVPVISKQCKRGRGTCMGYIVRYAVEVEGVDRLPDDEIFTPGQQPGKKTPVAMYDLSGNFLMKFNSVQDAASEVGCRPPNIFACISHTRRQKRAAGYMWHEVVDDSFPAQLPPFKVAPKSSPPNRVAVCQYNRFTGEKIATFASYADAAASCNGRVEAIRNCTVGKTHTSAGYMWRLASDNLDRVEPYIQSPRSS